MRDASNLQQWPVRNRDWWDMMCEIYTQLGDEQFARWAEALVATWDIRERVIGKMAWNDPNSEYALDYARIMSTRKFQAGRPDEEEVSAGIVAESLRSMLDGCRSA